MHNSIEKSSGFDLKSKLDKTIFWSKVVASTRLKEVKNCHSILTIYLWPATWFTNFIVWCHLTDPKLPSLLKMLMWAQDQLDEKAAYPRINDLSTAMLEDPPVWDISSQMIVQRCLSIFDLIHCGRKMKDEKKCVGSV